jgi:hypothetical protein
VPQFPALRRQATACARKYLENVDRVDWRHATIGEAQLRTELFLTDQMLEALHAVEYELPSFDTKLHGVVGGGRAR